MARPSKRKDAGKEAIVAALLAGNTRTAAASVAGITRQTFYRWLDEDATFSDNVEKAEGSAESRMVRVVQDAAFSGTWQAAAWWLERRRRDEYALKQVNQIEGNPELPLTVVITERPDGPQ